jgi:uracil-DNA glycosylase
MLKNIILKDVKPEWNIMWEELLNNSNIIDFLEKKYKKYETTNDKIFPNKENILEAFKYFDLKETKLVFLGQDPYINSQYENDIEIPQATGLAFSVPNNFRMPPSLKNIHKELMLEYKNYEIPKNGNLIRWVKDENILLLNTALTVKKGLSNSHQKKWSSITDSVIKYISDNHKNVIFLLLGNNAKSKAKFIDINKHNIISGVHPSPLSAKRGFFNSNIFIKVNEYLKNTQGCSTGSASNEINW